ncbi:hypothetical protein T484DRAFT_3296443 [Baffinella frigidus]|nr:hypothetical protein T484DRAFT_3296443 [Cryptophyta sp. CCMP2293]
MNEREFLEGLAKLDTVAKISDAQDDQAVFDILLRSKSLSMVQRKECLMLARKHSEEDARQMIQRVLKEESRRALYLQDVETRKEEQAAAAGTGKFSAGQGAALFRKIHASASGWLRQGEFISALSKWMQDHPPAASKEPPISAGGAGGIALAAMEAAPIPPRPLDAHKPASADASGATRRGGKAGGEARKGPASSSPFMAPSSLASPYHERPDLRNQVDAMVETARRAELDHVRKKLASIREAEERLQARNKDADRKEAHLKAQEALLKQRDEQVDNKEEERSALSEDLLAREKQVLALTKELQEKIKEVETRAEWLKSQRLVIQQREEALAAQEQRLGALQERNAHSTSGAASLATSGAPGSSAGGSLDVEQLAELIRGVGREEGSRRGSPGKGARKAMAPKVGGVLLREVAGKLDRYSWPCGWCLLFLLTQGRAALGSCWLACMEWRRASDTAKSGCCRMDQILVGRGDTSERQLSPHGID